MRAFLVVLALAGAALSAAAQGTLSTQGYGYPAGPLSSRALGMGGGIAELDPLTPLNPASLTSWGRSGFYAQYGPEFRSVEAGGTTDNSTIIRFPLIAGAVTVGDQWTVGFSFSDVLDRTWGTEVSGWYPLVSGDSVHYTQNFKSAGSLTNVRAAAGYRLSNSLRIGFGLSFLTGQNTLAIVETFADSDYAGFAQVTVVNLSGTAVTAGLEWSPIPTFAVGLSGQLGGPLRGRRNDTLVVSARAPSRAGTSLLFAGISGVVIAADAEWTQWSAMNGLEQSTIVAQDTWDYGAGAEIKVAGMGGADLPVRLGYRWRQLPFPAGGQTVTESNYSFGFGIPVATGRGRFDFGIVRAIRSANVPVQEKAWIVNVGILVRP